MAAVPLIFVRGNVKIWFIQNYAKKLKIADYYFDEIFTIAEKFIKVGSKFCQTILKL